MTKLTRFSRSEPVHFEPYDWLRCGACHYEFRVTVAMDWARICVQNCPFCGSRFESHCLVTGDVDSELATGVTFAFAERIKEVPIRDQLNRMEDLVSRLADKLLDGLRLTKAITADDMRNAGRKDESQSG